MYNDWTSDLEPQQGWGDRAAISAFKDALPWNVSRDFVMGTAKHLAGGLGMSKLGTSVHNKIEHDKQLLILMPALGYGLSFPLSEIDILRDCVSVYCDWLSALLANPKPTIPTPILNDPNHYARVIINHFYYLFVPRSGQGPDVINRQAVLCHRVLRSLQTVAQNSKLLDEETWQTLLLFLLHINSALLSPPMVKDDAGEQLCERVLSVLFETWLMACAQCFPPPPLWTALRESCQRWRHRAGLIEQWNRINYALTAKLIAFMYGPSFPAIPISDDDLNVVPSSLSRECIAQVWYRFLHVIGNPVDLSRQLTISKTPAFLKYAISSELVIEPSQHPCLQMLPAIFLSAMKGISVLVDAFLGTPNIYDKGKSPNLLASSVSFNTENKVDSSSEVNHFLASGRAKVNSLLHLFGPWLFEAALVNCHLSPSLLGPQQRSDSGSLGTGINIGRRSASVFDRNTSETSVASEITTAMWQQFQLGRAEAVGALCRIFGSKKTGEEILPAYVARFYLALHHGLQLSDVSAIDHVTQQPPLCTETAANILLNGSELFRLDLPGITSLVPSVVAVLEVILPGSELTNMASPLLRRSATQMLLSLLPLPLHFKGMQIKEIGSNGERISLSQLKPQLINLLANALQVETDPVSTQMLLGGLLFCVQDAANCEAMDSLSQHQFQADQNIMSSGASDTLSSHGDYNSVTDDGCEGSFDNSGTAHSAFAPTFGICEAEGPASMEDPDSAHLLFVRAIYLVCPRLISSWTSDVNVSLAGLELLSGLARLSVAEQDGIECHRAVKWLCDYIAFQCSRPARAHSKDLHSTIVAAFHCASIWLVAHPYLLNDKDCLSTVLEVIELGISGSKSQASVKEPSRLKHQKELKPASMRVKDAAEALLSCVLSQVGNFPPISGAESVSSLLDEVALLRHCNTWEGDVEGLSRDSANQHFRYFVSQNSVMLALLEQPLGNHQDPQPTLTALIRGPFGRMAWTMQLRHLPRHKASAKVYAVNPGRPLPMNDMGIRHNVKAKYFPDSVDRIPSCKADKSIPCIDSITQNDEKAAMEHEKLLQILDHQVTFEESVRRQVERQVSDYTDMEAECVAPPVCQEFQTARLLLTHFGFFTLNTLQEPVDSSVAPIVALDSNVSGFVRDLEILDSTNSRTIDTVHIFYVRAGQTSPSDILSNVLYSSSVNCQFLEFLQGLGWSVKVHSHPGWTGHISTSFNVSPSSIVDDVSEHFVNHGGSAYDGSNHVLYWADAMSELALVVPSLRQQHTSSLIIPVTNTFTFETSSLIGGGSTNSDRSDSFVNYDGDNDAASSLSSHTSQVTASQGGEGKRGKYGRQTSSLAATDYKVLVVWLESFEDYHSFPTGELLQSTQTGLESGGWREKDNFVVIIFIHALADGLFRLKLHGQSTKLSIAGPLVDGQIVSKRVLATLVRQTTLNICRRRRLESDSYQPPHVRRKLRIQEIVQKYAFEMTEPEFYTHLFSSPLY